MMSFTDPGSRRRFLWLVMSIGAADRGGAPAGIFPACGGRAGPATARSTTATAKAEEQPPAAEDRNDSAAEERAKKPAEVPPLDPLALMKAGGFELVAIVLVSIVAMAFAVERFLALRRRRVIPGELVSALWRLAAQPGGIDPRQTVLVCQQHPSTLGTVVRAALQKLGRPNSEMEAAVAEASAARGDATLCQRAAGRTWPSTWLPMLGLLGTIRGVIVAFHGTANLPANMNKTVYLADGIYQALVNTFAGIAVAVPAAIFAHLLEGRIMKLITEVDDFVRGLLPQLERFEGRHPRRRRQAAAGPAQRAQPNNRPSSRNSPEPHHGSANQQGNRDAATSRRPPGRHVAEPADLLPRDDQVRRGRPGDGSRAGRRRRRQTRQRGHRRPVHRHRRPRPLFRGRGQRSCQQRRLVPPAEDRLD